MHACSLSMRDISCAILSASTDTLRSFDRGDGLDQSDLYVGKSSSELSSSSEDCENDLRRLCGGVRDLRNRRELRGLEVTAFFAGLFRTVRSWELSGVVIFVKTMFLLDTNTLTNNNVSPLYDPR